MNRKITISILFLLATLLVSACSPSEKTQYERYRGSFFDTFDTVVQVVGYTETEQDFQMYMDQIEKRFQELHKSYDIYNNYDGINNMKTINDNAGIQPVKVNQEIIDLLLFSKDLYEVGYGKMNIAMGAVLDLWHEYREEGLYAPYSASLPPMEELLAAAQHTDIDKIIIDEKNSTVYLADENMHLNVGAVAKGYATELVAQEIQAAGFESGLISAGGNVRALGSPKDGVRDRWGVGIQDPNKIAILAEENLLDTIFVNNTSVVSSGDYERYYIVDGKLYHHLIDPETLMPEHYYRGVTVVIADSGVADVLSTVVFLLPYEESRKFVESFEGAEALWIMLDGSVEATEGMKKLMKSQGASAQ